MSPRIIQLPLSGRDRRHYVRELKAAEEAHRKLAGQVEEAYRSAHALTCQEWNTRQFIGGPAEPSPRIADAIAAGFALDGTKWDGLYVARRKGDDLVYAGKVDHGFDKASAADLRKRLTPLVRKTQAFSRKIAHKGIWVEPKLLAEIEYRAKSAEGKVRHPFFKGIREDL